MTAKDMCEAIARWQKQEYGRDVPPEKIWNLSPTGELWPMFALYDQAKAAGYRAATDNHGPHED